MMLAQFDFGMQEHLLTIVKAIAAVGGAVAGWFACDPLTRIAYRLSFKGATPGAVLFLAKASGATALGAAMWILVSFGGGAGGFGPGKGGLPGKGPGPGGDVAVKDPKVIAKDKKDTTPKTASSVESVEIEIIDAKRFQDDERYFLVKGAEPALSRDELETYLKKNQAKIEVTPVLTKGSIRGNINPLGALIELTKQYDIKTLRTKTP